ncbi:hypothetical protein AB595_03270 [Massilia sp. WF1]|uniref:zinc-binding dehydrogenase n=1 Tax=unclassified Massilia TaxID=2609279 RepID=UPI0006497D41|nr:MULTISPECIES: zinc-binding dehydrogenase [unclassified Massilia]ALK96738.1 hypothetical protein AM586_11150 [Massilia sp. WG5]KLU38081.1 hypothetical protein AB595_03270 [Massilia sp. WF1]
MKQTMKALVLNAFEVPMNLSKVERPVAGPGQVLVRIKASVVEVVGEGVQGCASGNEVWDMTEAAKLVDAGKIKVLLDERHYSMDEAGRAHAAMQDGSARGKIVVEVE